MKSFALLLFFAVLAAGYAAAVGWLIERAFKATEKSEPSGPDYDWGPFVRLIKSLQDTRAFVGVKWLQGTRLARDPQMAQALQVALDREMLKTYKVPNPKNPQFPVTACRLNESHPQVVLALKTQTTAA